MTEFSVKIIDFYQGIIQDPTKSSSAAEKIYSLGSLNYLAPEVLQGNYSEPKSDVWSIGAIVFTLLCGENPFVSPDEESLKGLILKGAVVLRCIELGY